MRLSRGLLKTNNVNLWYLHLNFFHTMQLCIICTSYSTFPIALLPPFTYACVLLENLNVLFYVICTVSIESTVQYYFLRNKLDVLFLCSVLFLLNLLCRIFKACRAQARLLVITFVVVLSRFSRNFVCHPFFMFVTLCHYPK